MLSPWSGVILGCLFHLSTQSIELDHHGWLLTAMFNGLILTVAVLQARFSQLGLIAAAFRAVLFSWATLLGLFLSIIVQRLFLSPLRKYPGPFLAKITKFYTMVLQVRSGNQLYKDIRKMHEEYGDIVRTGPRELSILKPSAIPLIYGAKSKCTKSTFYSQAKVYAEEDHNVFALRNHQEHAWRRRKMDRGLSIKALNSYEPRVRAKVDLLLDQLLARQGQPINTTDWMSFFSFDAMGDLAYGRDFKMLAKGHGTIESDDGKEAKISHMHSALKMVGVLSSVPWMIRMLAQTDMAGDYSIFMNWCKDKMREKQASWHPDQVPTDIASHLITARETSEPAQRQTQTSLDEDSVLLIVAGSDTTSGALGNVLYYLTKHQHVYRKLQALVDEAFPNGDADWSYEEARKITYIDHVCNESMRMKTPAIQGLVREVPAGGLQIEDEHIPAGTIVSVPTWSLYHDPRVWEDPDTYKPERFEGVDVNSENVPFLPFLRGAYACPGKNLAYMEMRSVLSRLALRFDLAFAPGETGVAFDEGPMDTFTMLLPPLHLVLTERKKGD
ncbi:cytochrome P450 [Phyllosticta citribraziliensis]|uniref:Cytochrome P450 n=1 Tax=Phyllosticta citribraziliensis TaxID=989973 RepID=A0ABR1LQ70_9PEZI